MKNGIRTVLIIHDELKDRRTLCLSSFLEFCGIWTDEISDSCGEEIVELLDGRYDLSLYLWETEQSMEPDPSWRESVVAINYGDVEQVKDGVCLKTIDKCLEMMEECYDEKDSCDIKTLKKLSEIYLSEQLRIYDYNGKYYFYSKESSQKAYQCYSEAYQKLDDILLNGLNESFIEYAKAYCIKCMHQLALAMKWIQRYDVPRVIETLKDITDNDKKFVSCWYLMGQLSAGERTTYLKFPAVNYYQKCVNEMCQTGRPIIGIEKVYYAMGGYWEKVRRKWNRAIVDYKKAYAANRSSFRALYKIGVYKQETECNYKEALNDYRKILDILNRKTEADYLQPIEAEYIFKTLIRMLDIYMELSEDTQVQAVYQQLKDLNERHKNNRFYPEFYGLTEEAAGFRRLTQERISLKKAEIKVHNYYNGNRKSLNYNYEIRGKNYG